MLQNVKNIQMLAFLKKESGLTPLSVASGGFACLDMETAGKIKLVIKTGFSCYIAYRPIRLCKQFTGLPDPDLHEILSRSTPERLMPVPQQAPF